MKRSLQYARTDRDIIQAFISLLHETPFEKITVQNIITEAMVNRSTFYEHFEDKYALLEAIQQQYLDTMFQQLETVCQQNLHDLSVIDSIMQNYFLKNRSILRVLLQIRTEHVDIVKKWHEYIGQYFAKSFSYLSELELSMLSGLIVSFFTYYIENENNADNYSTLLFESLFHIFLQFIRVDPKGKAADEFLDLIHKHAAAKK